MFRRRDRRFLITSSATQQTTTYKHLAALQLRERFGLLGHRAPQVANIRLVAPDRLRLRLDALRKDRHQVRQTHAALLLAGEAGRQLLGDEACVLRAGLAVAPEAEADRPQLLQQRLGVEARSASGRTALLSSREDVCSSDAHVRLPGIVTAPFWANLATSPVAGVRSLAVLLSERSSHRSPGPPASQARPLARSVNEMPAVEPLQCTTAGSEGSSECTCASVIGSRVFSPTRPDGSTVTCTKPLVDASADVSAGAGADISRLW